MKKQRSKRISAPTDRKLRSSKNECVCQMVVKPVKDIRLFQLREENEFTDAVVRSQDGGCEKKVHGIILASLSPDFQQKLLLGRETSLNLPCSAEVVNCLINLAYTGGCVVKNEVVEEVLDTAQVYGIKALKKIGTQFLIDHLCDANAVQFLRLAEKVCCAHVVRQIFIYICCHFKDIQEVMKLSPIELCKFLHSEHLQMSKKEVANFINSWKEINGVSEHEAKDIMNLVGIKRTPAKILMALGGWSISPCSSIEFYDYINNTWSIADIKLPLDIAYHGAEVIDNKLYIVGGYAGALTGYLDNVYCFDMIDLTWTEVSPMSCKRCYVSTAVMDGQIYALGGHDGV